MALTFAKLFSPQVLGVAATTIYTCPVSPATSVLKNGRVRFTNTTAAAVAVTAYAVPPAGAAGAGNAFLNAESVAPNTHLDVDIPSLGAGDTLQALAGSAASVTALEIGGIIYS